MVTALGPRADGVRPGSKYACEQEAFASFSPRLPAPGLYVPRDPLQAWPSSPPQARASAAVDQSLLASGLPGPWTLQPLRPLPFPGNSFPA